MVLFSQWMMGKLQDRLKNGNEFKNEKKWEGICMFYNLLEMTSLIVPTIIGAKFGLTVEPESLKISII